MLVAPPKVGKSWLALSLALAAASGGRALGRLPVRQRPVLYLALEDGHRRLQGRMRALEVTDPPAALDFMTEVADFRYLATIAAYLERHAGQQPLVILDTLGKAMPPQHANESPYQRDYRVVGSLKALVDRWPGSSIVLVHHTRKAETSDFLDAVSGTQGLAGAADTIILLKRDRQQARAVLHVTSRDAAEGSYALDFESGRWTLAGEDLAEAARAAATDQQTAGVGDRMAEVVAFVNRHPGGVRRGDLAAALNMQPDDASKYLGRAAEAGRICKSARGLYTPLSFVSALSFSDEDDDEEEDTQDTKDSPLEAVPSTNPQGHSAHNTKGTTHEPR